MKLKTSILSTILLCAGLVSAQSDVDYWEPDSTRQKEKKISTSVNVGSSISSDFNGGSAFTSYVAPSINYQLNPRWVIGVGTVISNTSLNNWTNYRFGENRSGVNNFTQQEVFAIARYKASDDLTLTGAIYHSIWSFSGNNFENNNLQLQGNTYTLGMEYKITDSFRIGVEVSRSDGYQPFQLYNRNRSSVFGGYPGSFGGYGWR